MFEIQNYAGLIVAVLVFQAIPGPGTLTILNATARGGAGAGMAAVFGTLTGDFLYMLAAVSGLAALLDAYPYLLAGARWVGIAYLCAIGWKLLRAQDAAAAAPALRRRRSYFLQAMAVALSNPKAIMFFMAFFPLFLSGAPKLATLAAIMAHVTLLSLIYETGLVFAGGAAMRRLAQFARLRRLGVRLAGAALIAFGAKLAAEGR